MSGLLALGILSLGVAGWMMVGLASTDSGPRGTKLARVGFTMIGFAGGFCILCAILAVKGVL